jgi:ATP-independent RNA helicase DbpA
VLNHYQPKSAIVFANLKATVAEVAQALEDKGLSVAEIHGDLEQRDRDRVMALFRNGSKRVLIATDVAARGLDVKDLDLVINFDLPHQAEVYVHRIGRTGRAGQTGVAISLATPRELHSIGELEKAASSRLIRMDLSQLHGGSVSGGGSGSGANGHLRPVEALRDAEMQTLCINGGRKEKLRPGDIMGALTGDAGFAAAQIGKIEIHDHFAYVAVARTIAQLALNRLREGKIKGRKFLVRFEE